MLTQAELAYNDDYIVLRTLFVTCKVRGTDKVEDAKLWIRETGKQTAVKAENEIKSKINSDFMQRLLARQSHYEQELMKDIHEPNGYDGIEQ